MGIVALPGIFLLAACTISSGPPVASRTEFKPRVERIALIRTGLDVLQAEGFATLRGKRVGLITNQSGVDRGLRPNVELLRNASETAGLTLAALFAPEHGFSGAQGAGVVVGDSRHSWYGIPVYSLYGVAKKPTGEMLQGIDILIYDIQDVGSRTYTYLSTLVGALEAAAEKNIELWILDRPDPLGGEELDGPVLDRRFESFVGPHPVPLRYGLTPGEFARMVNEEREIGARLHVVPLDGWRRGMTFQETGLPWVAPSPNIPTPDTCPIYSGFVLLEGTNLSEGRGTTRPFKLFGAPWLDSRDVAAKLNRMEIDGVKFRPTEFTPTFSKFAGKLCRGVEVHVTDPKIFRACVAVAAVLAVVREVHPEEFHFHAEAFDRLAGGDSFRQAILRGEPIEEINVAWKGQFEDYRNRRKRVLMYP